MDGPAELGRGATEIENVGVNAATVIDGALRQLDQTEGLRHLARTGVLGARRSIDQQDACFRRRVLVLTLGLCDRVARREPVDREIVIRIGKSRTSLAGVWRL